jgi:hypothetical protein
MGGGPDRTHASGIQKGDEHVAGGAPLRAELTLEQDGARHQIDERGHEATLQGPRAVHHLRSDLHLDRPVGPVHIDGGQVKGIEGMASSQAGAALFTRVGRVGHRRRLTWGSSAQSEWRRRSE